jgi:phosphate starvation-inducible PhoH-like protein
MTCLEVFQTSNYKEIIPLPKKEKVDLQKVKFKSVSARTDNQRNYIKEIVSKDIVICEGPAGSGKTHIAIGMAMQYLYQKKVDKILIARPAVESGEDIGYLPGDADAKLSPYVRPVLDELQYFASWNEIKEMQNSKVLEIVPIGYMRGRTFKDAFVVVDECQNCKTDQIKMVLTRLGDSSKMVLTGDATQSDLEKKHQGGFQYAFDLCYEKIDDVGCVELDTCDIIRHPLVGKIVNSWPLYLDNYQRYGKIED